MVAWKVSLIGPKNDKSVEQTSTDYKSAEQQLALIGDWFHCRQGGSWFYYGHSSFFDIPVIHHTPWLNTHQDIIWMLNITKDSKNYWQIANKILVALLTVLLYTDVLIYFDILIGD